MRRHFLYFAALVLSGCVHESAIPLGNDMAQIDVSAAPVYGRAGAERIAMQNAANFTLKMGYDKFIVMNANDWNETGFAAGSFSQASANGFQAQGTSSGYASTFSKPEAKMVIRMFHNGDKGAEKAVDAQAMLSQSETKN